MLALSGVRISMGTDVLVLAGGALVLAGPQLAAYLLAIALVAAAALHPSMADVADPPAEAGVERAAQLAQLTGLGCQHAQGFFLHRPQPADAITTLLAAGARDRVA